MSSPLSRQPLLLEYMGGGLRLRRPDTKKNQKRDKISIGDTSGNYMARTGGKSTPGTEAERRARAVFRWERAKKLNQLIKDQRLGKGPVVSAKDRALSNTAFRTGAKISSMGNRFRITSR